MKTLVFFIDSPDLSSVPRGENVVYVPMRWDLELDPRLVDYNLVDTSRWRSFELSNEIRLKLDRAWQSMQLAIADELIVDYSYYFYNIMTPIEFWRHTVRSALAEYKPNVVFIPDPAKGIGLNIPLDPDSGLNVFFKSACYQVLAQETSKYVSRYFPELPSFGSVGNRVLYRNAIGIVLREPFHLLSKLWSKILRSFNENICKPSSAVADCRVPRVLIIGQENKCVALCDLLSLNKITYLYRDDLFFKEEVYQAASVKSVGYYQFPCQVNIDDSVVGWFMELLKFRRNVLGYGLLSVARECPDILLTDSSHNYLVRGLIRELKRLGKNVVVYPEGTGINTSVMSEFNFNYDLFDTSVFRFCISENDLHLYESNNGRGIVTGYFADTFKYSSPPSRCGFNISRLKNVLTAPRRTRDRPVVFFDLDLYADIGVGRAYLRPDSLALQRAISAIRELTDNGFSVVANMRFRHFYESLLRRVAREHFVLYLLAPWQSLVNDADVVVVYQSSIGLESLALNKPVVVFDPFEYPTYIDAWSSLESDVVRTVSEVENLVGAVELLIASPKRDFSKYEQFFARQQHCAVNWIQETLNDCESRTDTGGDL